MSTKSEIMPYNNNLEYLSDGLAYLWSLAKSRPPVRGVAESREVIGDLDAHSARLQKLAVADRLQIFRARIAATLKQGAVQLPLEDLAARHNLSEFEKHVLLLVLAPSLDPQFSGLLEEITRCHRPEVCSVLQILCDDLATKIRARTAFTNTGSLLANGLLNMSFGNHSDSESEFMRMELDLPRQVSSHILGTYDIDDQLISFSSVIDPKADFQSVVIPDSDKRAILELVENHEQYCRSRAEWGFDDLLSYGKGIVMLFSGPPGVGKTMMAHALANRTDRRLMLVDVRKLVCHSRNSFEENLARVFHESRLQNAIILFDEADELFTNRSFNGAMPTILREFERLDGICILATNRRDILDDALERRILLKLDFEIPTAEHRQAIWRVHLPPKAPQADDIDLAELAEEFEFSGGFIKNSVLVAVNRALAREECDQAITHEDLRYGALTQRQNRLGRHADKIIPAVTLDDVVSEDDTAEQLQAVVSAARNHGRIFRSWGMGRKSQTGMGLSVLLSGPSGTGKTFSAEAIAGALGRNLYPVNLATLVSKYVGDTEKNLQEVFATATDAEAVIFFDEADTLFAARLGDGSHHAHYINQQINSLLAQIEKFNGMAILATNRPEAIDPAFQRRIRYHIRFSAPSVSARKTLWQQLLADGPPLAADIDVADLATRFELTGGQIRQVVLRSAFAAAAGAGEINHQILCNCAQEELPLKKEPARVGFHAA